MIECMDKTTDIAYNVWCQSKANTTPFDQLYNDADQRRNIMSQLMGYSTLEHYVFHCKGSMIFRDFIFTITTGWAVSNRLTKDDSHLKIESYKLSDEYKDDKWMLSTLQQHVDYINKHKDQPYDRTRIYMPYGLETEFWFSLDLNMLVATLDLMRMKYSKLFDVYGKSMIESSGINYAELSHEWIDTKLSQYFLPEVSPDANIGNHFYKFIPEVGAILYSQLIRQNGIKVAGYLDRLAISDHIHASTPIDAYVFGPKDKWDRSIKSRCCTFSMSDNNDNTSWSYIIDSIIKDMSIDQFSMMVPCDPLHRFKCILGKESNVGRGNNQGNLPKCPFITGDLSASENRYKSSGNELTKKWYELHRAIKTDNK